MRNRALTTRRAIAIIFTLIGLLGAKIYLGPTIVVVQGASMSPTFVDGQVCLVDSLTYRLRNPKAGEIIMMQAEDTLAIKRIFGVPGDHITFRDSKLTINGSTIDMPVGFSYKHPEIIYLATDAQEFTLGATEYYVLGDNRATSNDSRVFGPIKRQNIVARVITPIPIITKTNAKPNPDD